MSSATPAVSQREELAQVLAILQPVLDIVHTAVEAPQPPDWFSQRNWHGFLSTLDDEELATSERGQLATVLLERADAPADLRQLAAQVQRCTRLHALDSSALPLPAAALRGVAARKRGQLATLLGA